MHSALRQRMSRVFQRLDEIISHVATAAVVSFVLIVFIVSLALRDFLHDGKWISTVANAIVIMLLFALKHTQDRQQTALQLSSTSSFDLPRGGRSFGQIERAEEKELVERVRDQIEVHDSLRSDDGVDKK